MFYSWPQLQFWLIAGATFGAGVYAFRIVRARPPWMRVPIRIVSSSFCSISFLLMSLWILVLALGCESHSEPVLSPLNDKAARIETDDEGAVGGHSGVAIYTHYGFSVHMVLFGSLISVAAKDLHWKDDSTIEIRYEGSRGKCQDAPTVHVICVQ